MKKNILKFSMALILSGTSLTLSAQAPPPPPASGHGSSQNESPAGGTSAPLTGGSLCLLTLGAAYLLGKTLSKPTENHDTVF